MNIITKLFYAILGKKDPLDTLKDLASTFAILSELEQKEAFHWHPRERILLIEEIFARIQMAKGKEGFHNFLDKITMWQNYRLLQQAYEQKRIDMEAKAIREALQNPNVSDRDVQRIKQEVLNQLPQIPLEQLGPIKSYDIYIIRTSAPSAKDSIKTPSLEGRAGVGSLVAVGHYNSETEYLEMSLYEDIKHNLG